MMRILWIVFFSVVSLFAVVTLFGYYQTWQVQTDPSQHVFENGKHPYPLLDGFYRGSFGGTQTGWKGKKFDNKANTGINIVGENKEEKFPFVTRIGKGITDTNTDVLKIDYNSKENPFWLRFILDEIVEIKPGKYLGKVHLLLIPGYPFTLGYFTLEK